MTKILSIVWYKVLPARYGGQKGTALFNKYLGKHFPITCLCSRDNSNTEELTYKLLPQLPLSKSQFINPFCWIKIYRTAKKEQVTHAILEHPYHGISAWILKKFLAIKIIVHSHNIESERFREQGKGWWWILQILEKWTHRYADFSFFKTEADRKFALRKFRVPEKKSTVISYGIETFNSTTDPTVKDLIYERHGLRLSEKLILFAGTLDYEPNAQAVESIFRQIAPRLDDALGDGYRIIICGRNRFKKYQYLKSLMHRRVIYAGEVDDIENYFMAADVFINPVRTSSGIQTKIIEAVSHGLNTVIFESQNESLELDVFGDKILPSKKNDWNEFHIKILESLQKNYPVPEAFYQLYSWENIVLKIIKKGDLLIDPFPD